MTRNLTTPISQEEMPRENNGRHVRLDRRLDKDFDFNANVSAR